jgi:hypothetical protein
MRRKRRVSLLGKKVCTGVALLQYVLIVDLYTVFVMRIRSNYRQSGCIVVSVMRFNTNIINSCFPYAVTQIYYVIPYELTPLCPDGVECTHLT